eukprot:CAMPEP_0170618928 /NCGR_PEP_ID=MMETSP0224-20130122/27233_1 /TAXON_ID=285029 /ORGANISM="Togula jolla, Strain CCCM 725" /LENGTH=118 /DNA_ID=CAMNT_0010944961 /DNA_START=500 /DNA_END=853 /DNA_ORIENTATION=+
MKEVFAAPYAADLALVAMEYLLRSAIIVPEVAELAEVAAEDLATCCALRRCRLSVLTPLADDFLDVRPLHLVAVFAVASGIVVAVPAPKRLTTARGNNAAPAAIVATSKRLVTSVFAA